MITTELDRYEYTGNANPVVFRSGGTDIPIRNTAHVKVYVTTTGVFTADIDSSTVNLLDTGHGHIDGQELTLSAATSLPTGLLANTIYYVVNKTTNTFQVSLSSGGDAVAFTTNGSGTLTWTKTLLKAISTDYTVALVGTTATVTWESGKIPGATDKVLFLRDVTFEQVTDLQNNSQFEAESVEGQLDLMVNMSQQLKNTSDRQFRFSNVLEASDATEASATLTATSAGRADKGLRFDSLGNLGVSTIDIDLAQDYILEAKSYATQSPDVVNSYSGTVASPQSGVYSSKEHAVGTPPDGSSKEWATTVDAFVTGSLSSSKEYAQGDGDSDAVATGGSAKGWAQDTAKVNGATTNDRSAKAWSQGESMTGATLGGSAKDWAQKTDGTVTTSPSNLYSAKEYAQSATAGTNTYGGSAKGWASTAYDTAVPGAGSSDRSALHYSTDASNSALAAKASAAAVASTFDSFDDTYLGTMGTGSTQGTNPTPTGEWEKDSSTITVSANTNIKVGQVVTGHSSIPAGANVLSIDGTAIVISASMTAASPGTDPTLSFIGYGVYGTYNSTKVGPTTDNDNGALADGMLYFNTTTNNMMVYKTTGATWILATSAGEVSQVVHKFTASGSETSVSASSFSPSLTYVAGNIIVFLNGVRLDATDYTATNGADITDLAALAASDELVVLAFKQFEVADAVSAASGGTFAGAVTFSAGLTANTADINAGTVDGATIGASSHSTGKFTTCDATTDFTIGGLVITDNTITDDGTLTITATTGITLGQDTALAAGKDIETSTTGKIKQKGAFMQSSTHQALTLGY